MSDEELRSYHRQVEREAGETLRSMRGGAWSSFHTALYNLARNANGDFKQLDLTDLQALLIRTPELREEYDALSPRGTIYDFMKAHTHAMAIAEEDMLAQTASRQLS